MWYVDKYEPDVSAVYVLVIFSLFTVVKNNLHKHELEKWLAKLVQNHYTLIFQNQ